MGKTSIEWTDHSWPVVNGCRRKSAGCTNCYAERLISTRLSKTPKYGGLAVFTEGGPRWSGEARLWSKDLEMPIRLRKSAKIFVADMGDLFYEGVPFEVIDRVMAVVLICRWQEFPKHTFQFLTKRPERMAEYFAAKRYAEVARAAAQRTEDGDGWYEMVFWKLEKQGFVDPGIWLGVSVEDQETVDERIPILLKTPAAVRFVSAEPLLERIDLQFDCGHETNGPEGWVDGPRPDWVILGAESGPGSRPCDPGWLEAIVKQGRASGVPIFCKQLGSRVFAPWKVEWASRIDGSFDAFSNDRVGVKGTDLATVWPNGTWHTWDANGIGGENDTEPTVELAKAAALEALQRQHVRPIKGWARHAHMLRDRKGGDMSEWPEQLRVRQFPTQVNQPDTYTDPSSVDAPGAVT